MMTATNRMAQLAPSKRNVRNKDSPVTSLPVNIK
jgi:hypothetical protein